MSPAELNEQLPHAALAFRGYNVTNLGRSDELLKHPRYSAIVKDNLRAASKRATEVLDRQVDLVDLVSRGQEPSLEMYGESLALVLAMESAQVEILQKVFQIDLRIAQMSFGYSLGEIAALVAGGVLELGDALEIPLMLSEDCIELARTVTLGVLFTRAAELPEDDIRQICLAINSEGRGVIGVSSHLSPNSILLMGQHDTLDRFKKVAAEVIPVKTQLRKHSEAMPPLHTPIVWERNIPNRAAFRMHTLPIHLREPYPPVLSLVTGMFSYTALSARAILHQWTDHPQRLWEAIYETLTRGVKTILHIGPEPNLIPATYKRLSDNVRQQMRDSFGMRALAVAARRPWLKTVLPQRAALLRAPQVRHIFLEDWLLENAPK